MTVAPAINQYIVKTCYGFYTSCKILPTVNCASIDTAFEIERCYALSLFALYN